MVGVAPAAGLKDAGLVEILERIVAAGHVAIDGGISHRHLGLVAGGQQHLAELVGKRHQEQPTQPRLDVFLGNVRRGPREQRRQSLADRRARARDRHRVQAAAQPLGHLAGVLKRGVGGVFRGQHHAAHVLRAQGIGGDGGHQRGIDPPRKPQQHLLEAALAQVVAQRLDHHPVVLFPLVGEVAPGGLVDGPARLGQGQVRMGDGLVEQRHLQRQRPAPVEPEGAAVEHLVILPAHGVEVKHRQVVLDHPGNHDRHPPVELATVVGRAVGHHEKLRPAFGQGLAHVRIPGVLADREADVQRPDPHRPGNRPGTEHALFVENPVVGQEMLADPGDHPAAGEDVIGVEQPLAVQKRGTDRQGRPVGAALRQLVHGAHGMAGEGRLHHQILGLIAGDEHLGQGHQPGPRRPALGPGTGRAFGIAGDVAHGRVELGKGNAKTAGHGSPSFVRSFLAERCGGKTRLPQKALPLRHGSIRLVAHPGRCPVVGNGGLT